MSASFLRRFRIRNDAGGWLLIGIVLLAAQLKILTYVTGEDSFTYSRLAGELIERHFSADAWGALSGFIAPGYPAMLAGAIVVFGPLAVAWVNFVLLLAAFGLLLALCRRWEIPNWGAAIGGLCVLVFTFRGGPLNAHFLLYAFRGAPQFLFMVGAMYLAVSASPDSRWAGSRLGLATGVLLLGAALRETTLLAWPGLAGYLLLHPDWRSRWGRALLWLAAPAILALGALLVLATLGAVDGNLQVQTWIRRLTRDGVGLYLERLMTYGQRLYYAGGCPAAALFIWGAWRCRAERLVIFLIPALLLMAFYAGFIVHPRYLLDSCLLAWAVAGIGAWHLVADLGRVVPRAIRKWLPAGAIVILLVWNGLAISALPMWGPRVLPADLKDFVAAIEEHGGGQTTVLADLPDRYLTDALMIYARRYPRYHVRVSEDALRAPPLLYLRPESRRYWKSAPGLELAESIERFADLTPVVDSAGQLRQVRLGPLRYTLYLATPWTNSIVEEALSPKHVAGQLLWLDFRRSDPEAVREIRRVDRNGNVRQSWTLGRGTGLVPFALTNDVAWRGKDRLVVTSSGPMPRGLLARPLQRAGGGLFTLAQGRRASALDWVADPVRKGEEEAKWGATFTDAAAFRIPRPVGGGTETYRVSFVLEPRFPEAKTAIFQYRAANQILAAFTNALDGRRMTHEVPLEQTEDGQPAEIRLQVEGAAPGTNHFRVVFLGGRMERPELGP